MTEQVMQQMLAALQGAASSSVMASRLQIYAVIVAVLIAGVVLYSSFVTDWLRAEELTRKLTLRGNEADRGSVGLRDFMNAYIEWLASPAVLFFAGRTRKLIHEEQGGTKLYAEVRRNGYESELSADMKKNLYEIRKSLHSSVEEARNWGKWKFFFGLFWRRRSFK